MAINIAEIRTQVEAATAALIEISDPDPGSIFVLGASTSEIQGKNIGTAGSERLAKTVLEPVVRLVEDAGLFVAVQCCEHLNRSLVVPPAAVEHYRLRRVTVVPRPQAGGAVAARAMDRLNDCAVVEGVPGQLGMDIGDTFIGMHLVPVAVPVRLEFNSIGGAHLTLARTRPPLVGGRRAEYPDDPHEKARRSGK